MIQKFQHKLSIPEYVYRLKNMYDILDLSLHYGRTEAIRICNILFCRNEHRKSDKVSYYMKLYVELLKSLGLCT